VAENDGAGAPSGNIPASGLSGLTENAGPENERPMRDHLDQSDRHDWKMRDQISRVEKCRTGKCGTGKCGTGKCRTGKCRTKSAGWKMQDRKMEDQKSRDGKRRTGKCKTTYTCIKKNLKICYASFSNIYVI